MNFNQWRGYAAKKNVTKVTYCCGEQSTLVELVVDDVKSILNVPSTDLINFQVGVDQEELLWELASQYSLDPTANRLVVVRGAESIKDWTPLSTWLANSRNMPNNYILFVSYDSDAPANFTKGKRTSYKDHIELIRNKGRSIKCSQPSDDDLVAWAMSYGLSKVSAEHLIERVSGDPYSILNVCSKISVFSGSPAPKAIDVLCDELALDSFADYLILRDKRSALLALESMSEEDKAKVVGRLDARLSMLVDLGVCVRKRMFPGDITQATGIKTFLVKRFSPVVKDYDTGKIKYCRQVLALVDGAMKNGVKTGPMEALVGLW